MRRGALILGAMILSLGAGASAQAPDDLSFVSSDIAADRQSVAEVVAPLFNDGEMAETRALLVMHRGEVVAERYAPGYGKNTPLIGWSMSKCITAITIGMLVADGRLTLDRPAPVAAWAQPGDPRGRITLRQLLNMSSGLEHEEGLGSASDVPVYEGDTARMLFLDGAPDMADYAERHPLEDVPGGKFEYSTATSMILADIATRTLTDSRDPTIRREAMRAFLSGRLFEPIGMKRAFPEFDAAGTLIGGSLIHATARDWAQLGELLRLKGRVKGAQIIPERWVRFMTEPSPREDAYGAHIWLNRRPTGGAEPVLFPNLAPSSVFACLGHGGQYVIVSPSQKLTVVRLGRTDGEDIPAVSAQLGKLVALFPQ